MGSISVDAKQLLEVFAGKGLLDDITVVCVTGKPYGGKGLVAEYLKEKGYFHHSTRDNIIAYARRQNPDIDRRELQRIGDTRREGWAEDGRDEFAESIVNGMKWFVFDSGRYPEQMDVFSIFPNVYYLWVDAHPDPEISRKKRFEFDLGRKRGGDPKTWEGFLESDQLDWDGWKTGKGQNTEGCYNRILQLQKSGRAEIIYNDGEKDDLRMKAYDLADRLERKRVGLVGV